MSNAAHSQLFQPFRCIGHITSNVPVAMTKLGQANFVAVSIGKAFQVYNCDKLRLMMSSPPGSVTITCLATHNEFTFCALGCSIQVWRRLELVRTLTGHTGTVKHLLVFGEHLVSVAEDQTMRVWDLQDGACQEPIELPAEKCTALMHPDTYLNKILLAFENGVMELWNLRTRARVFRFTGFATKVLSAITTVVQSPAVDVVAVGFQNGQTVLHNLKFDKSIGTVQQDDGAVTAVAFRTDQHPVMCTSSTRGNISVWDLQTRNLITLMRSCHASSIHSLHFLPNQPVLMSAGGDNAIKQWIFDQQDGAGRLLRSRSGHSEPPTRIRFYGDEGDLLLSAGQDKTMRLLALRRDEQSVELSQGSLQKQASKIGVTADELRAPPVVDFAATNVRARDFANIISCHRDSDAALTWSTSTHSLNAIRLKRTAPVGALSTQIVDKKDNSNKGAVYGSAKMALTISQRAAPEDSPVTAVAVSGCGHFGLCGTDDGRLYKYAMQSGLFRGEFSSSTGAAHDQRVVSVAVDALNRYVVSASLDGSVKFWDFHKLSLIESVDFAEDNQPAPSISQFVYHSGNELLAVACDDLQVRVVDASTKRVVRMFKGYTHRLSDMCFSPDGRWLVLACADATLRVYDLPSARLIDWCRFSKAITSVAFSPTANFLATTHVNSLGVHLWANLDHFSQVFFRSPSEAIEMDMPRVGGLESLDDESEEVDASKKRKASNVGGELISVGSEPSSGDESSLDPIRIRPLGVNVATLSALPRARWHSLANLDLIKARNRPKEAPKAQAPAPFFLPTVGGLSKDIQFAISTNETQANVNASKTKMLHTGSAFSYVKAPLVLLLEQALTDHDISPVVAFLSGQSASGTDSALRQLGMEFTQEERELGLFLDFVAMALPLKTNFELIQAYLNVFLHIHADALVTHHSLLSRVDNVQSLQRSTWTGLEDMFQRNLCLVQYLSNIIQV